MSSYTWLYRRKGVFQIYFAKALGRKSYSLKTKDRTAALEAQRRLESQIWESEHGITRKNVERIRLHDLIARFLEHKRAVGIAEATLNSYCTTANRFGAYLQTDLFVDAILPAQIEQYIARRRSSVRQCDEGKEHKKLLTARSVESEAAQLRALFNWGVAMNYLGENPMKAVTMPKRVMYDSRRALTPSEYLSVREKIAPEYRDPMALALLSGLRRSDLLLLTSENFDFEQGVGTFYQGKTGRHKDLPISNDLAEVAKRMIERVGPGRPLIDVQADALTVAFRKARIMAGLPPCISWHSLRHTFASWLAQAGVDFTTLKTLTGHQSSRALEIYLHSFDATRRSAIERLQLPKAANQ